MSLLGAGVVLVWCDIEDAARDEHEAWHSYQHMPERIAIPGFLRARRGITTQPDAPRIFVIYELQSLAVVSSPEYLARLNNPTEWTRRMMGSVKRLGRTPCRIIASHGSGTGTHVLAVRIAPPPGQADALRHWLVKEALPEMVRHPGLLSVHLLERDQGTGIVATNEQQLRGRPDDLADWVIVVDGYDARTVADTTNKVLSRERLLEQGAAIDPTSAQYDIVHVLTSDDPIGFGRLPSSRSIEGRRDGAQPRNSAFAFDWYAIYHSLPVGDSKRQHLKRQHLMTLDLFFSRAGHLIRRMNQISVAIFLEETRALGLTTVQYAALNMIDEVPNIDQARLSSMIAFDTTTLVKVLDRLTEKGLITRTRSQTDRRKQLLNATAQGHEVVRRIQPMIDRSEQRILAPLSPSDRRKFMEMLTQLVNVNNVYSRAPLDSGLLDGLTSQRKQAAAKAKKNEKRRAGART